MLSGQGNPRTVGNGFASKPVGHEMVSTIEDRSPCLPP